MKRVKVTFRKFPDGDIIALFPEMKTGKKISSYMHVGQHSEASPELLQDLEAATPEEYKDLEIELECIGYNLEVCSFNKFTFQEKLEYTKKYKPTKKEFFETLRKSELISPFTGKKTEVFVMQYLPDINLYCGTKLYTAAKQKAWKEFNVMRNRMNDLYK